MPGPGVPDSCHTVRGSGPFVLVGDILYWESADWIVLAAPTAAGCYRLEFQVGVWNHPIWFTFDQYAAVQSSSRLAFPPSSVRWERTLVITDACSYAANLGT